MAFKVWYDLFAFQNCKLKNDSNDPDDGVLIYGSTSHMQCTANVAQWPGPVAFIKDYMVPFEAGSVMVKIIQF